LAGSDVDRFNFGAYDTKFVLGKILRIN